MSTRDCIDRVLRDQAPVLDGEVMTWGFAELAAGALGEVRLLPVESAGDTAQPSSPRSVHFGRRRRIAVAVAALAALVFALPVITVGDEPRPRAYAAELLRLAEDNPRLVIADRAWRVLGMDSSGPGEGNLTYGDGEMQVDLRWWSPGRYRDYLADRSRSAISSEASTLLGFPAVLIDDGQGRYSVLGLVRDGMGRSWTVELAGPGRDPHHFSVLASRVRAVSVDDWLAALPDSMVRPVDRAAVVAEFLVGLPLPPGFDTSGIQTVADPSDRYQLGAAVVSAVGCSWFDRWFTATETGNRAEAVAAARALRSAREWPVLHDMAGGGEYPRFFWSVTDTFQPDGTVQNPYGPDHMTRQNVAATFGCAS